MNDLMKTRKNEEKCNQENVLQSYYDDENSGSENPASWENAGAEHTLCVCDGSSAAAWKTSDGWSKNGCNPDSFESILFS